MLRRLLLLALAAAALGCGSREAADPEAAFATWLAGLPAPVSGDAFSCNFSLRLEMQLPIGGASELRVRGSGATATDGRMRWEAHIEAEMPDAPANMPTPFDGNFFTADGLLIYDGEKAWAEATVDADWMGRSFEAFDFDPNSVVMTLDASTVERLLPALLAVVDEQMVVGGMSAPDADALSQDFGPANWVHAVGRTTAVRSFRDGGDTIEVGFGLDPAMLPDLPGVAPGLMAEAADGLALRMLFDAETGMTRAARLEHKASEGTSHVVLRVELTGISTDAPDPGLFVYEPSGRLETPLEALIQPLLAGLPQPGDEDLDF